MASCSETENFVRLHSFQGHDPPLTEHGAAQSQLTGRYLKKYFESKSMKFDKFVIECAPSMGAIMTACLIAQELDHSCVKVNAMLLGSDHGQQEFMCTSLRKRRAQKESFLCKNTQGSRLTTVMDFQRSGTKLNGTGYLIKAGDECKKAYLSEFSKCETQAAVDRLKRKYNISDKIDLLKNENWQNPQLDENELTDNQIMRRAYFQHVDMATSHMKHWIECRGSICSLYVTSTQVVDSVSLINQVFHQQFQGLEDQCSKNPIRLLWEKLELKSFCRLLKTLRSRSGPCAISGGAILYQLDCS